MPLLERRRTHILPTTLLALCTCLVSTTTLAATLRIDNGAEPRSLDPQKITGLHEMRIDRELFEPLVSLDAQGKPIPGLAYEWEISPDGTTWTFHLRDAQWSDGTPITAEDAVFAFQRALLPATHSPNANLFYPIVNAQAVNTGHQPPSALGVRALDEKTFEVKLTAPVSYMLDVFTDTALAPLPRHALKALDNAQWIAQQPLVVSGPYRLAHWVPQVEVGLEKNTQYYQANEVQLDNAVFYPIDNGTSALNRYRSGDLDISYSQVPSARYEWVKQHLADDLKTYPVYVHYGYLPNMRSGQPLADKRIREAMNLTLDRTVITDKIIRSGQIPSWSSVPSIVVQGQPPIEFAFKSWPAEQRLARAKTLMHEAGYGLDHPLELEMSLNSVDEHRRIAVALSAMWKPLGINTHFTVREGVAHYGSIHQGQFQLGRYAFAGVVNTPADELSMYVSNAANNYTGYHNPEFDRYVAQGIHARSQKEADEAFAAAQRLLIDDMAVIPIFAQTQSSLVSTRLKGWAPNPLDMHPLRYLSF